MKNTIEETTRLLLNGTLSKDDADKILLNICNVMPSLPSHIDAGIEAKHYGDEMNKLSEKPNGFNELDFYNGTVWLRQMIEGNET